MAENPSEVQTLLGTVTGRGKVRHVSAINGVEHLPSGYNRCNGNRLSLRRILNRCVQLVNRYSHKQISFCCMAVVVVVVVVIVVVLSKIISIVVISVLCIVAVVSVLTVVVFAVTLTVVVVT